MATDYNRLVNAKLASIEGVCASHTRDGAALGIIRIIPPIADDEVDGSFQTVDTEIVAEMLTIDAKVVKPDDGMVISCVKYKVLTINPDDTGMSVIRLERVV